MKLDKDLTGRVMTAFFQEPRNPGAPFWSMREIASRFECTRFSAMEVLRKLTDQRVIERIHGKGCFLHQHLDMKFLTLTKARRHPGIVPPLWHDASSHNVWTDYVQAVTSDTRRRKWNVTYFSDHVGWGDFGFAVKFKLANCNVLIAIDPDEDALVTFTELHQAAIPIVVIGTGRRIYEKLGVATVESDEAEAMKAIMLHLFHQHDVKRPLLLAYGVGPTLRERHAGCVRAYQETGRTIPYDAFLDGPDDNDLLLDYLRSRMKSDAPPDALIFHESAIFEYVATAWPGLIGILKRQKIPVVVFDDLHVAEKWPTLKIIRALHPTEEIALGSMMIAERLLNGQSVPHRTFVPRIILWK